MGFFKRLFGKNKGEDPSDFSEWDRVQSEKESLDLKDPVVREQYVRNCLDEMKEASDELDRINAEYALVTSYLTDMEEVEAVPEKEKNELADIAKHIHDLRKSHDSYVLTPSLISSAEYDRMDVMCDEVPDGIKKMKAEEEYKQKVKEDLLRIGRERKAYDYRKKELISFLANSRYIASLVIVAVVVLVIILFALSMLLNLEVAIGYYISIALAAISLTVIYVRYANGVTEKGRIENTINELILLENKVKIRYVNNKNLLDYYHTKFGVNNSAELQSLYEKFIKEKEDRKRFERNEAIYEEELSRLVKILKQFSIKDPQIWIHQTDALYDSREMVEIRHGLIGRRQKLRKQMEYNEQIALEASDEIKTIINDYPDYASSVMALVDAYEKEKK